MDGKLVPPHEDLCGGCDAGSAAAPTERYLVWQYFYGQTNNRLFATIGALAVAQLTGRTVVVPDDLHTLPADARSRSGVVAELDVGALAAHGVHVISQSEFTARVRSAQLKLGAKDVYVSDVSRPVGTSVTASL